MKRKPEPKLACMLLAAGGSERLGEPKQLLEFKGESLVLRAARLLLTQSHNVVVVSGAHAAGVGRQLDGLRVRITRNENWESGMGSSIASGMSIIGDDADGVLILLCDQWRIEQKDLQDLVSSWKENLSEPVVARWKDGYGSPAIIPRELFAELCDLSGDHGAKAVIARQSAVRFRDIPNAQFDLDTSEDLEAMKSRDG